MRHLKRFATAAVGSLCVCASALGCANEPEPDASSKRVHENLEAAEPEVRAQAVDQLVALADADVAARLEEVVANDPDGYVRERAVTGYGAVRGRDAVALCKQAILSDGDERVVAAAFAVLHTIAHDYPQPPRGSIEIDAPPTFEPGKAFDVHVRVGSSEVVPKARITFKVPEGVLVSADEGTWLGRISDTAPRELVYTVRASQGAGFSAQVRAKLDYAQLDAEVLETSLEAKIVQAQMGPKGATESRPVTAERTP